MIIEYLIGVDESLYISIIEVFVIAGIVYYLFLTRRE